MKPAVFCRKLKTAARLFSRVSYYCITEGPIKAHERVKTYLTVKHEREILHEQMGDFSDCIEDYAVYDSEYQDNLDFSGCHTDIKALAFYLPQFHTFSENDAWWGKGFTEWTNTRKSVPRFKNHYQPREPHEDIGYYDLSNISVMKQQVKLAKQHGIYGFCFYYYWFSGKRLMEKPVDLLLEHPEIDINFCLCWANENWSRTWDGADKEILIKQEYTDEDAEKFMADMKKYIDDSRYIRIEGKPVILVYNPGQIPSIKKTFKTWRRTAKELGIGDILIWTCQTANNSAESLKIYSDIDAEVEFPPHNMWWNSVQDNSVEIEGKPLIANYQKMVALIKGKMKEKKTEKVPVYHTCMMGWDNAARRKNGWATYCAYSIRTLYDWLNAVIEDTRQKLPEERRFIFINAWNEWAEGTYLEPDRKYGYANINTVSKAIFELPFEKLPLVIKWDMNEGDLKQDLKIAVQVHLYYLETLSEIIEELNKIPYQYDCFITTDTDEKEKRIRESFEQLSNAHNYEIMIVENRGRDVAPFLVQMKDKIGQYDYLCHIHSKKTTLSEYGDMWRKYLYWHLFGTSENIKGILQTFENNSKVGLIFPETYPVLLKQAVWGGNKEQCRRLMLDMGLDDDLSDFPVFPVGNMFWCRTNAVKRLFEKEYGPLDFPEEQGQLNATLAHQIERIWIYLAEREGYAYTKTFNDTVPHADLKGNKIVFFAHFDKENKLSEDDIAYVKTLYELPARVIFITNSELPDSEIANITPYVESVIKRKNEGYDFGAWKAGVLEYGINNLKIFDQVILANNSCYRPVNDLTVMFSEMEQKKLDFWGVNLFPYFADGSYINSDCIKEHIQSFFLVFQNSVVSNACFEEYWETLVCYNDLRDVVKYCESELTDYFKCKGFKYGVYVEETRILSKYLEDNSIPYHFPYELLILKSPYVKKKCRNYISKQEMNKVEIFLQKLK